MKIIYLHIGMGRCGSSALQTFGSENRDQLQGLGLYYPTSEELGFPHPSNANAMGLARHDGSDAHAFAAIGKFAAKHPCNTFLLSSEYLRRRSTRYFATARDRLAEHGIRTKLLIYVRGQREFFVSRYAQAVKAKRWTKSLEEFLRDKYVSERLDYASMFGPLLNAFQRDDILVRIFERERLSGGDVRRDALAVMNIAGATIDFREGPVNASASVLEVELMRAVNRVVQSGFNHRLLLRMSRELASSNGWAMTYDLYRLAPPSLLSEIGTYYQDSNETFRSIFFPDHQGQIFRNWPPDAYEPLDHGQLINEKSIELLIRYYTERHAAAEERRSVRKKQAAEEKKVQEKAARDAAQAEMCAARKARQIERRLIRKATRVAAAAAERRAKRKAHRVKTRKIQEKVARDAAAAEVLDARKARQIERRLIRKATRVAAAAAERRAKRKTRRAQSMKADLWTTTAATDHLDRGREHVQGH